MIGKHVPSRISVLALTLATACAKSSDADPAPALPTCPDGFQACGGDLLGRWELSHYCFTESGSQGWYGNCAESTSALIDYGGTVTYDFAAEGTLTTQSDFSSTIVYRVPTSCGDVSCSGLQLAMQDAIEQSGDQGSASCSVTGSICTCTAHRTSDTTVTQSYEIAGTELLLADGSDASASVPYCVSGDTLVIQNNESFEFTRAPLQP